jgi:hypothetical protein
MQQKYLIPAYGKLIISQDHPIYQIMRYDVLIKDWILLKEIYFDEKEVDQAIMKFNNDSEKVDFIIED